MPTINLSDDTSTYLAGTATLGFALWKLYLRVRADRRLDSGQTEQQIAYSKLLGTVQAENSRLALMVKELSEQLDEEINNRRNVARENVRLTARLEAKEVK